MTREELLELLSDAFARVSRSQVFIVSEDDEGYEHPIELPSGAETYVDPHPDCRSDSFVVFVEIDGIRAYDHGDGWAIDPLYVAGPDQ